MKTNLVFTFLLFLSLQLSAQDLSRPNTIAVLDIDSKGFTLDPTQMGNITRIELNKTGVFQVMDRYDVSYLVEKNALNTTNCYGRLCLIDVGKVLKTDKILEI